MAEINFESLQVDESGVQVDFQNILQSAFLLSNNLDSTSLAVSEDEGDVFLCGRCREQFVNLTSFLDHKKNNCKAKNNIEETDDLTQSFSIDALNSTEATQVLDNPIILSFAVDSDHIEAPSNSQPITVFGDNDTQFLPNTLTLSTIKAVQIVQQGETLTSDTLLPGQYVVEDTGNIKALGEELKTSETPLSIDTNVDNESSIIPEQKIIQKKETDFKFKCQFCGKQFRKNFDLQQHLRSHTGERPYQCIVCGRTFAQKSNVMKHMATHKVWPKKVLTLPKNHFNVISSSNKESSKGLKGGKNVIGDQSFACEFCPSFFSNYVELRSHLKNHVSHKVYKCIQPWCSATFEDLDAFLKHSQTHVNGASYKCHICYFQFSSLADLAEHQSCHDKNKSSTMLAICRKCKGRFSSPESLEHHLATDSHSYPCAVCQKIFTSERFLRRHLMCTHSSTAAFPCSVCNKAFRTEHHLNLHMVMHSDARPYTCKVCLASFSRKDKLSRHKRTHDFVKPFKCPFGKKLGCTKEYSRREKLNEHILTHGSPKSCCHSCREFLSTKFSASKVKEFFCVHDGKIHQIIHKLDKRKFKPSDETTKSIIELGGDNSPPCGDKMNTIEIVVMPMPSSRSSKSEDTSYKLIIPADYADSGNILRTTNDPIDLSNSGGV